MDTRGNIVMAAKRETDLYFISEVNKIANAATIGSVAVAANIAKKPLQDLHEKLGHLNIKDVKSIIKDQKMHAVDIECCDEELQKCEVCVRGKMLCVPFGRSTSTSSSALELIHTDICGPMRVPSFAGSRYFATFVDDKTRYCEVFMAQKSEIFEKFKIFKAKVEKQTGLKIKKCKIRQRPRVS